MTQAGEADPGPEAAQATASSAQAHAAVAAAFRTEAGHLTASLVRSLGDFDLAEESLQEAVRWPASARKAAATAACACAEQAVVRAAPGPGPASSASVTADPAQLAGRAGRQA